MNDFNYLAASNGSGEAVRATVTSERPIGAASINVDALTNWPDKFIAQSGAVDAVTHKFIPGTVTVFYGSRDLSSPTPALLIEKYADGYSDIGHQASQVIVLKQTTEHTNVEARRLQDVVTARDEMFADNVVRGTGEITTVAGREASISNITYYMSGIRLTKTGIPNKTFTATKDTYCYIDTLGAVSYIEVAVDAAAPATPANSIPFAKVTTNASAITGTVLMSRTPVPDKSVGAEQVNFPTYSDGVWTVRDYGSFKEYTRSHAPGNVSIPAGGTGATQSTVLPSDVTRDDLLSGVATLSATYSQAGSGWDRMHGTFQITATHVAGTVYNSHSSSLSTGTTARYMYRIVK